MNKASFTFSNAVVAGSTISSIQTTLAQANGYFDLGYLTFTSGVNSGVSRGIKSYSSGVVNLIIPLPSLPSAGDTFTICI